MSNSGGICPCGGKLRRGGKYKVCVDCGRRDHIYHQGIRKPTAPPTLTHRTRNVYSRKIKHKNKEFEE